jgi:hypothetical protein
MRALCYMEKSNVMSAMYRIRKHPVPDSNDTGNVTITL